MVSNVTEEDEPRGGASGETSGPSDSRKIFFNTNQARMHIFIFEVGISINISACQVQEQSDFHREIQSYHLHSQIPIRAVPALRQHLLSLHRAAAADPRGQPHREVRHHRASVRHPLSHCGQGDIRGH